MDAETTSVKRRIKTENSENAGRKTAKRHTGSESENQKSVQEVITFKTSHLPAQHYDQDTTEPVSYALKSLDQLLSWKRSSANPFNETTVPLRKRWPPLKECQMRTLVSHDMMGGYLEDRFIQGTEVDTAYVFYHWNYIDIFNYFSHNLVTIPPAMWTNAAHKHGVLSLGTFITEWKEGGEICEVFLAGEEQVFFDACDGIFTNYNWTESSLEDMVSDPAAQGRLADIYVGIDVFARGAVVGGKFETNKALELVRKHRLSTAIFAPGWVYECNDKLEFNKNQDKFWSLLSDGLYIHHPEEPLPFVSSFCQGYGKNFFWRGKPLYTMESLEAGGWLQTRGCFEEVWTGGNSLLLEGTIPKSQSKICARIFPLHVSLASRTFISCVYQLSEKTNISLELNTTDAAVCTHTASEKMQINKVIPAQLDKNHELLKRFIQGYGEQNSAGWITSCFILEASGCTLRDVCVTLSRKEAESQDLPFTCKIGEILVLDAERLLTPLLPIQNIFVTDVVWHRGDVDINGKAGKILLNATLRWSYLTRMVRLFRVHWRRVSDPGPLVGPETAVLIGRAYSPLYRVVDLEVEHSAGVIEFLVEPVNREGFSLPQSHWGKHTLSYTPSSDT
ncbi:Cytosolic endo-beta-N-acetylglucosaminidase [Bagarius yarrelli]|uniref:mannosyl-glycoprotein endo-beta-N-acetylglucosaminidase n=1 Tax=Bagarius yarrelli TaxID=175774 RepID=A0A556TVS4_BAGYA|nr:Cytosolic endo-beta-N-acetylglucosaminidase [Bagarius yarrelli]